MCLHMSTKNACFGHVLFFFIYNKKIQTKLNGEKSVYTVYYRVNNYYTQLKKKRGNINIKTDISI